MVERVGEGGTTVVVVDTGPDLREQLLSAAVTRIDGVVFTHDHADHVHGIDDLRPITMVMRQRIACFADPPTSATLMSRFGYCFASPTGSEYPAILGLTEIEHGRAFTIDGPGGPIDILPAPVFHGGSYIALSYRFNNFLYCPDIKRIYDDYAGVFEGLDLLVLDALRHAPHPTHFNLAEALALIDRVKPRRAILTNLHTDLDFRTLAASLPAGVEPAYDGLVAETP